MRSRAASPVRAEAWWQGGHVSTIVRGVWPFILGLALTVFAILALENVLGHPIRKAPRYFLACSALMAMAVLGHPMSIFFLALSAPVLMLVFALGDGRDIGALSIVKRAAAAAAATFVLVLFWIVPSTLDSSQWTYSWPAVGFGGHWMSFEEMFKKILQNELFDDFSLVAWILGAAGFFIGFFLRRPWAICLNLVFAICLLFVGASHAAGDTAILRKVQIVRFAAFLKLIWFALAGLAVDWAGRKLNELFQERFAKKLNPKTSAIWLKALPPIAGLVCAATLVAVNWDDGYKKVARIGRLGGELWGNIVEAEKWLAEQPRGPLDRVLYQPGKLCVDEDTRAEPECELVYHQHIFASGPLRTHLPKVRFGYEPTAIFSNMPLSHMWPEDTDLISDFLTEPQTLVNLHIRWIVSIEPWPERDDIREVKRFGDVIIYSVTTFKTPPVRLDGPGELQILEFSDERISVSVEGAGPQSRILYPIAYYYPWHAYRNGKPIAIETHGVLRNMRKVLMDVRAGDGVTELRYERPLRERLSNWVSLSAWTAFLLVSIFLILLRQRRGKSNHAA
jgi:hypothetical protein